MHLVKMCSVYTTWHASTSTYVAGPTEPGSPPFLLSGVVINPNGGFDNPDYALLVSPMLNIDYRESCIEHEVLGVPAQNVVFPWFSCSEYCLRPKGSLH